MNVEFHFDFGSPNAYLAHQVIPGIEARTGESFEYVPVLLGGVFKATNNVSPAISMNGILNKPEYSGIETRRFLKQHNISDYQSNPFFPVNTLFIMRGAVFAQRSGFFEQYVNAVYRHMWVEGLKMDDPEVIGQALESADLPVADILAGTQDPDVKQALIENTSRSVSMGTFGSPTFYVDSEIYFGKDKLSDVEANIQALLAIK